MSTPASSDSYVRAADFESRLEGLLLPNEAWAIFAQLEKPCSVEELARTTGITSEAVQSTIDLLVKHQLVRKHLMDWRQFLASKGIRTGSSPQAKAPAETPPTRPIAHPATPETRPTLPTPRQQAPEVPTRPAPAREISAQAAPTARPPTAASVPRVPPAPPTDDVIDASTIRFALANDSARANRRALAAMEISFRLSGTATSPSIAIASPPAVRVQPQAARHEPRVSATASATATLAVAAETLVVDASPATDTLEPIAEPSKPAATGRRLRPLLDAITRKGGGGLNGQLLVYRVFLRVPAAMMHSAGIKSLSLVDDSLTINDSAFYQAIRDAASKVASLDLDSVAV